MEVLWLDFSVNTCFVNFLNLNFLSAFQGNDGVPVDPSLSFYVGGKLLMILLSFFFFFNRNLCADVNSCYVSC